MSAKLQEKNQNDLFEQYQTADKRIRRKTRFLLPDIKNSVTLSYENIILTAIIFVMSCIIAFSLGVEKGRYDSGNRVEIKTEKKGGVSNVTTSKSKNIRNR
ncbi:MAG: hypothetical protein WC569_06760 [Candidatus Omnitrophota bacterium]